MAVLNLLRLHTLTTRDSYRQRAERAFKAFAGTLKRNPVSLSEMLLAWDFHRDVPSVVILVIPEGRKPEDAASLLSVLRRRFLPNRVVGLVTEGSDQETQSKVLPLLARKYAIGGRPTAYVCKRGICRLPTSDPLELEKQLGETEMLKL